VNFVPKADEAEPKLEGNYVCLFLLFLFLFSGLSCSYINPPGGHY
jgi:hypothetical protein